jgi:hypothetical protein
MIRDMLISHVILDDRMTGHNYLDFLQNGLPEEIDDVPLVVLLCTFSMTEPFSLYPTCDATSQ